jgi:hypothetical protein
MAVAGALGGQSRAGYLYAFAALVLCADLIVLALLLRNGNRAGAWYWALVPPMLGSLWFTRIDVIATAFAVAGLLCYRRPLIAGALLGLGGFVKIWPLLALAGFRRGRQLVIATLAAAAVVLQGLAWSALTMPGALSFLVHQGGRGLEAEAVAATPVMLARLSGGGPNPAVRYGSWEIAGPAADIALWAARLALVAAVAFLVHWWFRAQRFREKPFDVALTVVLLAMVTSPVLSPQYLTWAIGVAAVCLTWPGTTQRPIALLLAGCVLFTHLEFPLLWNGIMRGQALAMAVLALRNGLLLVAACWSAVRLWRSSGAKADEASGGEVQELWMTPTAPLATWAQASRPKR